MIGPDACIDDLASAQLPWSLDDAVRQQLAGLRPDERRALEALAVCGRPTSFDLISAVTELGEAELLEVLRGLVDRRPRDRGVRRSLLVRSRTGRRHDRAPVARPRASPPAPAHVRRDERPRTARRVGAGPPRPGRRPLRRPGHDRPCQRPHLPAPGRVVPGLAAGRGGPRRGSRRRRAAVGRHRGGMAAGLHRRGDGLRPALAGARRGRRRPGGGAAPARTVRAGARQVRRVRPDDRRDRIADRRRAARRDADPGLRRARPAAHARRAQRTGRPLRRSGDRRRRRDR